MNVSPSRVEWSESPPHLLISAQNSDLKLPLGILAGLAGTSVGYAYWLNTPLGKKLDTEHTWFVVFVGVAMTLLWLALHDPKAAVKAFACFCISGTPIVFRALFLDVQRKDLLHERAMK